MPTGTAIPDVRRRLFDAAERVLLRDGPSALSTRSVTSEAGCANGVLHRHFDDFDDFLAALVRDRATRMGSRTAELRESAGTGTVTGNLTTTLTTVFESVAVAMVSLITFRDGLRAKLRSAWPTGIPILTEAVAAIAAYLSAERELGRIAADADVDALALTLIGSAHLLSGDRDGPRPEREAVERMVAGIMNSTYPDAHKG